MKAEKTHNSLKTFITSEYNNLISYVKRRFNEKYYGVSAEDIVQDVALNLFSKLDFDEHLGNIAGYVYRSIKNKLTDLFRKNRREIVEKELKRVDDDKGIIENVPVLSSKEINDEKFYNTLYDALAKLSPNQQMVFIATEIDGCSFEELSEQLEIPIGTLLSWKHRGVKKLKELIKLDDLYIEDEVGQY